MRQSPMTSFTRAARHALLASAALLGGALGSGSVLAQDAARGAQLFERTGPTTGKQVGNCVACHANQDALREMLRNRGARPDEPRTVRVLLQRAIDGAQPGATNAKAQYRGVLSERDVSDLAAYIARAARS